MALTWRPGRAVGDQTSRGRVADRLN